MQLKALRTQWPVGQGNFSSGKINIGKSFFNYVYDCGANDRAALRSACAALRPSGGVIDAMFVSHLDSDHVNGIDTLTTSFGYTVNNLFLPYLTDLEAVILLASELANDSLTGDFVSFLDNPLTWAAARGVSNLYFIGRGLDPEDPGQQEPDDRPDPRERRWRPLLPWETLDSEHRGLVFSVSCAQSGGAPASNGSTSWADYPGKVAFAVGDGRHQQWFLVPWVPPMPIATIQKFLNAVQALGISVRTSNFAGRSLMQIVKDKTLRKALKSCYELLSANHNYVSMCLYSGPYSAPHSVYIDLYHPEEERLTWLHPRDRGGWLGTGDSPLKVDRLYRSFHEKFERFFPFVGTLVCPHHGSRHNFNSELLDDTEPLVCIASHGSGGHPYGHPHKDVVRMIEGSGSTFVGVTEEPRSRVLEHIIIK